MARTWKRVTVAIACWASAIPGVFMSFLFFYSAVNSHFEFDVDGPNYIGLAIPVAWLSLAMMTMDWIRNSRSSVIWLIFGTVTGLPLAGLFSPFIAFYFTLVGLAVYLLVWNIRQRMTCVRNA